MTPKTRASAAAIITETASAGLTAGVKILTLDGELPVEFLAPGDRVITRDSGVAVLKGIRTRKVRTRAVAIAPGSLGHDRPDDAITLPAGQRILLRDWRAAALYGRKEAMVPAARLADGEYIRDLGEVDLTVFELEFDRDHVIYAGGLELDAPARVTASA
ncbi:MAG: Hint domain-containing protein [Pseudooceanicola sp.]